MYMEIKQRKQVRQSPKADSEKNTELPVIVLTNALLSFLCIGGLDCGVMEVSYIAQVVSMAIVRHGVITRG